VLSTWRGPKGLIGGARPGTVLVDLSTVTPDTIRALEADVRATGAGILDAPVSGSVTLATSGQLTLMVGGTAEDLERARPALEPLAKTIVHVGPLGSGAAMKLAVNTVIFGLNEAVAEGLVLAEAAGIDRELAYDVIANSAVGAPYVQYKRQAFVDPNGTPVAFALDLAAKDLGLIRVLADRVGLELPQSRIDLEIVNDASDAVGGRADFSAVATHLRNERKAVTHAAGGR
jgi:3-hydroxyisobutyrate dehydrogenase/2-hydroxy-3-oxopropionate reductase